MAKKFFFNTRFCILVFFIVCIIAVWIKLTGINFSPYFEHEHELSYQFNLDMKKNISTYLKIDNNSENLKYEINFEAEMEELNKEQAEADDPRLVKLIKNYFIVPPSDLPYNLDAMDTLDTSKGQAAFVDNRFAFKEHGFFIESGAYDGEYLSNTLFLERSRHWTGVLIEPLPDVFQTLQKKNRKSYTVNACLSLHTYPSKEYITTTPVLANVLKTNFTHKNAVKVQCLPLYSIMLALNRTNVDFVSLDIEGAEESVLDTLPWDKVNIEMFCIEYDKWNGGEIVLRNYMESKGYEHLMSMSAYRARDIIFRKKNQKT